MIYINKRPSFLAVSLFPISKVVSSRVKNNISVAQEIYSNYNLENPVVRFYNQKKYLDGDISLTGKSDLSCQYDTYLYKDDISHGTTFYSTTTSPILYDVNDYGESRRVREFPNPVAIRTDSGKTIKFYQNMDFTKPVFTTECLRSIRRLKEGDEYKYWYHEDWYGITRVYNLIPGETYLYKVFDANNLPITGIYKKNSLYGEFTTEGQIRLIRLIGSYNNRDSGGYLTVDGNKRVKYGKLFRGALLSLGFFNADTKGAYNTNIKRRWVDGVDTNTADKAVGGLDEVTMQQFKELGITKDIDLRAPGTSTSYGNTKDNRFFIVSDTDGVTVNRESINDNITVNGQVVNDGISYSSIAKISSTKNNIDYLGTDILSYYTVFSNSNSLAQDNGKRLFVTFIEEVISGIEHRDENDIPRNDGAVYVHCQQGRDRTGTFMALLFALLGVNDDGILKDYELTATIESDATRWCFLYGTDEASNGTQKPKDSPTIPQGVDIRTKVTEWAMEDSPTGQYITLAQIDKLKELLLEDIPEEGLEAPINFETYQIENPTIKSYLTASKRTGANEYTVNDLHREAHVLNLNDDGDWSTWKPINMTKGVSINELKAIECPPGSGIKNMVENFGIQGFKFPHFLSTDIKTEAKPNYYSLNNPNIASVTITDLVTNENYTILDYDDYTPYVLADFGGVTDRFDFVSLPNIGTSTYRHVLDRIRPGLRKLGVGCKVAVFNGDVLSINTDKTPIFNPSSTFDSISICDYHDHSDIIKASVTPVATFTYTSDIDWSMYDNVAGTVQSPGKKYFVIFKSTGVYYAAIGIESGPLHLNYPTKIWNLIPGRRYHYEAKDSNNNIIESGNIKPEGLLRMLFLEGVFNVRDLGGWPCYDNNGNLVGHIAYDRLYRGGRPETDTTYWHRAGATMNDRRMMYNFIKLGKQLDLREADSESGSITKYNYLITSSNKSTVDASPFGLDLTTHKIPRVRVSQTSYWGAFDYTSYKVGSTRVNTVRSLFLALAEIIDSLKNNKSTYFNCAQGADRTQIVAMLVESLVGTKDDSIFKDWELTSFSGCLLNYVGSYIGNKSDYRALHNDCSEKFSPTYGHDLVRFIETCEFLEQIYSKGSLSKNIIAWFKQVSTFTNVNPLGTNTVRYMHYLGQKEEYLRNATGEDAISVSKVAGTVASSIDASYLGALNATAGTDFTNADQVIDYLRWKLIDWRSGVKYIAVLGDSLSAYKSDDRCPLLDLWWYRFAESIGVNPLTNVNNNSEGDTCVSRTKNSVSDMGCSWTRTHALQVNGNDPDLIFIMMGGNDWRDSSVSLGSYTYGDSLPEGMSTNADMDFKPAYALMLKRIKEAYPNATIVCINQPRLTLQTVTGHNWDEWMLALMDVAKELGCLTVDLCHVCGNQIYDSLDENDNTSIYKSDIWVHLNSLGHELIANIIK